MQHFFPITKCIYHERVWNDLWTFTVKQVIMSQLNLKVILLSFQTRKKKKFTVSIIVHNKACNIKLRTNIYRTMLKTSLTFKCLIEHLLADFSYSRPLDTYLWKQMMKMNRNITYKWCNIAKKHLLFTKRKCHKFSWLFTASRWSPWRRSICACRIACKVLVSISL